MNTHLRNIAIRVIAERFFISTEAATEVWNHIINKAAHAEFQSSQTMGNKKGLKHGTEDTTPAAPRAA